MHRGRQLVTGPALLGMSATIIVEFRSVHLTSSDANYFTRRICAHVRRVTLDPCLVFDSDDNLQFKPEE
ncbi:hypothetical protein R3P38DRAFT_3182794 [Favolaschia claudopus]|uniref:Uncharacterized protein n=1 Tax=Favolaschia claudopus TaxID=2862362 RepID=A0AAW0CDX1_9AGAR